MLLGLVAGNQTGLQGIAVYILVYTFTNLGALLVVAALRRKDPGSAREDDLSDIAGLASHFSRESRNFVARGRMIVAQGQYAIPGIDENIKRT